MNAEQFEKWIEEKKILAMKGSELNEVVNTSDLRALFDGKVLVPVEPYGCHCDLEPHMKPDGCVIDEGRNSDCVYAKKLVREGKGRDDCEYWQPIRIVLAASQEQGQ